MLYKELMTWPWWVFFLLGYMGGFVMAGWLLGWHSREVERDRERLTQVVGELRRKLREYSGR